MSTYLSTSGVTFPDLTEQITAVPAPGNVGNVLTSTGNQWASQTLPSRSYDVIVWYSGAPTASLVLLQYPVTQTVNFAPDFAGSQSANCTVLPTAETVFTVNKNDVVVGTMTYYANTNDAVFSTNGFPVQFVAGDVLKIVAPSVPDATLTGISIDLKGTQV